MNNIDEPVKPGNEFNPITDDVIAYDRKGRPVHKRMATKKQQKVPGKKCIVITIRKTFMKGHPRAGEATRFPEKIKDAIDNPGFYNDNHPFLDLKLHTLRAGNYWRKVVDKVNAGTHYLSVRTWDGRPYVDKGQTEVARFEKLGYQEFEFKMYGNCMSPFIDDRYVDPDNLCTLAANDGLLKNDFLDWFDYPKPFKGGIIHFTELGYFSNPAYFVDPAL